MRREWVVWAAVRGGVFVVAKGVYRASPGYVQMCDSAYSLLVTHNLLTRGTPRLEAGVPADPARWPHCFGTHPGGEMPYH